ncbi:MAG: helix-turn-helix transcriptional regulator [Myxococcota bacterium]|nr:helix-turn-helix transcriptional regulator [Myxococcota bacterium]
MNQPKTTLYENLSIPPQASRSEIDMAYRQALKGLEIEELAHYSVDTQGALEGKRQLLEKTYAILSRPDLKSRYDSGEAVPFAATLPEDQRRAVTARQPTREALGQALKEKSRQSVQRKRGESQQLRAFRDNFNPDHLRPIAEVESELLAGKTNIIGTRPSPETEPSNEQVLAERSALIEPIPVDANPQEVSDVSSEPPKMPVSRQVKEHAPATETKAAPAPESSGRKRGLEPEILRRVSEHAESLDVLSGARLADLRELAGLSREDMERITKVNQRHLRSIEADDYSSLPVRVYVRGFIQEYARALGLDRDRVSSEFLRLYDGHRGTA